MKSRYILMILLSGMLIYTGCSSDDEPEASITEQQIEKLKGSWRATTVTLDEVQQDDYDAFTLAITVNTATSVHYAITGNPDYSPWVSEFGGRFSFDERDPTAYLIREDDVSIQYSVTGTTLVMEFTYEDESAGGRQSSVSGNWKFTFSKVQ
ncbi:hypothetical protein ACFQ21_18645 [Ohtaekwangia kribbensis]|jgi:hypothetical protein|uniref:Lipocalin-like domain-containing protein n=1 Tax=Ohtaekwangia kribbensis TaxID=688913 RepID=A0ABW3K7T0_9BACT